MGPRSYASAHSRSGLPKLRWIALDGSGCVAVATKMAHTRETPVSTRAIVPKIVPEHRR